MLRLIYMHLPLGAAYPYKLAEQWTSGLGRYLEYQKYNILGTCASPDIYALALGCCMPLGVVSSSQAKHSCLCYNLYIYTCTRI